MRIISSRSDINLPYISKGGSVMPTALLKLLLILRPSVPSSRGQVITYFSRFCKAATSVRPASMLNVWSVPPISISVFSTTLS